MINEIMTEVFSAYEALDVEADEARAKTILRGLGFSDEDLSKEGKQIGALSGGWRMRVILGKALYLNPTAGRTQYVRSIPHRTKQQN